MRRIRQGLGQDRDAGPAEGEGENVCKFVFFVHYMAACHDARSGPLFYPTVLPGF